MSGDYGGELVVTEMEGYEEIMELVTAHQWILNMGVDMKLSVREGCGEGLERGGEVW